MVHTVVSFTISEAELFICLTGFCYVNHFHDQCINLKRAQDTELLRYVHLIPLFAVLILLSLKFIVKTEVIVFVLCVNSIPGLENSMRYRK